MSAVAGSVVSFLPRVWVIAVGELGRLYGLSGRGDEDEAWPLSHDATEPMERG